MTHGDLVARAEHWLRNTRRCAVVLAEPSGTAEIPDAIGWWPSIVIECKAHRSDFLRDRKKPHRGQVEAEVALGEYRYLMAIPGLILPEEVYPRWGLLEVREKSVRVRVKAQRWKSDESGRAHRQHGEMLLLTSELQKFQMALRGQPFLWPSEATRRVRETLAARENPNA